MTFDEIEKLENIVLQALQECNNDDEFLFRIDLLLEEEGYFYDSHAPCSCPDGGEHGHHWSCGWIKTT